MNNTLVSQVQPPLRGLYAITDDHLIAPGQLYHAVEQAILGGCRMVQYRSKHPHREHRKEATALLELCRRHQVPLIINDDAILAREIGADGVHVGKDDLALHHARQILGSEAIIGVSCYNSLELALQAQQQGASYVAFGSFFPSQIKPDAVRPDLELVNHARKQLTIPIIAIGGINAVNGGALVRAGVDMLAVISALFSSDDIQQAGRQLSDLFPHP